MNDAPPDPAPESDVPEQLLAIFVASLEPGDDERWASLRKKLEIVPWSRLRRIEAQAKERRGAPLAGEVEEYLRWRAASSEDVVPGVLSFRTDPGCAVVLNLVFTHPATQAVWVWNMILDHLLDNDPHDPRVSTLVRVIQTHGKIDPVVAHKLSIARITKITPEDPSK